MTIAVLRPSAFLASASSVDMAPDAASVSRSAQQPRQWPYKKSSRARRSCDLLSRRPNFLLPP
ncbi:hypothetical protein LSCM4_05131 [Leishmania orientalis]|uniref:Uncharacterized protein n=1 Tax=Leishmania orientalis TaxID=2249476 RepID=A0A836HE86_9TRYP|nr:hypothetical protein LSCM4_05131 [Leishmania orientalis]